MFPLGTVLFPTAALPIHVFEPRYRALTEDCLAAPDPEFGVVLIERGSEVGGGDVRTDVGTIARILEAARLPDGRWALGTVGVRRIRVERWLPDDPYPRAEVDDWPDPPPAPEVATAHERVLTKLRRALALAAELGMATAPATIELTDDLVLAGYQAAALAPVGPFDRQRLLAAPSASERVRMLDTALDDALDLLEAQLGGGETGADG
jgi:Lon protease-like protein